MDARTHIVDLTEEEINDLVKKAAKDLVNE